MPGHVRDVVAVPRQLRLLSRLLLFRDFEVVRTAMRQPPGIIIIIIIIIVNLFSVKKQSAYRYI